MTSVARGVRRTAGRPGPVRLLMVLTSLSLLVSAYVHLDLADRPWFDDGQVTLAGLFLAQAVAAAVIGLWLLVRPARLAVLAAGALALASLVGVVASYYVQVPSLGPLPAVYEPFWYTEKVVVLVATGLATVCAGLALRAGGGGPER